MVCSDNKPVEQIFNNPKADPPARIARWKHRVSQYNVRVKYTPGEFNIADYMSRNPIEEEYETENLAVQYINFMWFQKRYR